MRNLPNILTGFRIVIIPILVLSFYIPGMMANVIAAILFAIASITDFFDGYFARLMKAQSNLGKCLDPIADKLIVIVAIVMLINFGNRSLYILIPGLIIICREIMVSGLREFLAEFKVSVPVSKLAKYKTAVQMSAITLLLLGEKGSSFAFYYLIGGWIEVDKKFLIVSFITYVGRILFGLAAFLTLVTGAAYFRVGVEYFRNKPAS
jgi:CDP-diacylglycerol--glycerol-3-phosphate 3-phosphatidyltransferase